MCQHAIRSIDPHITVTTDTSTTRTEHMSGVVRGELDAIDIERLMIIDAFDAFQAFLDIVFIKQPILWEVRSRSFVA